MGNKLLIVLKYVILLGSIAVALIMIFGENTSTLLEKEFLPNSAITWYKIDMHKYLTNIETNITDTTKLQFHWQTKQWSYTPDWPGLVNNLAYMVNCLIATLNIMLYPLKVGGYVIIFVMAILGINIGEESSLHWLYQMGDVLLQIEIPYIP